MLFLEHPAARPLQHMPHGDEDQLARAARFAADREDGRVPDQRIADPDAAREDQPTARPHPPRQMVHRRQEAAPPGVPVRPHLARPPPVLEEHPVPQRRQVAGGRVDVQRRRQALDQPGVGVVVPGLGLSNEVLEIVHHSSRRYSR